VPYYTEPPGDVPRERELNRIFMDLSNGTQTWFDYLQNMDQALDLFEKYHHLFNGAPPRSRVAVWHSNHDLLLHPDHGWPQPFGSISEALREYIAYEIVDERMMADSALDALGITQLVLPGARWLEGAAWDRVYDWVERGGILIVAAQSPIADLEGGLARWHRQVPEALPRIDSLFTTSREAQALTGSGEPGVGVERTVDLEQAWNGMVRHGRGMVLTLDSTGVGAEELARVLAEVAYVAGSRLDRPEANAARIDPAADGVLATRFDDYLLYFNTTQEPRRVDIVYRAEDFPDGRHPRPLEQRIEVPARTIVDVPLPGEG
jgi:hypothetical protein